MSAKRSDEDLPGVDDWLLNHDDLNWLPWVPRDQLKISLVLMTDSSTMMISAGYHESQEIRWRSLWCWWLTPQPWWSQLATMSAKRSDKDLSGVDDWLLNHDDLSWLPWVPRDQMKFSLVLMTDSSSMMISAGYHECQEIRWRSPWCWWLTPQPWWSQLATMSAKRSDEDLSGVDDWFLNHDDLSWYCNGQYARGKHGVIHWTIPINGMKWKD